MMTATALLPLIAATPGAPQISNVLLGTGYEPYITTNRLPNDELNRDRVVIMWLNGTFPEHTWLSRPTPTIYRRFSDDLGVTWNPPLGAEGTIVFDSIQQQFDPCIATNLSNGDFYHGFQESAPTRIETRSTNYQLVLPGDADVVGGVYTDRPWLAASPSAAYASWLVVQPNLVGRHFRLKRATVSSGPNLTWPTGNGVTWYSSITSPLHTAEPNPIVAVDPQPSEAIPDYLYGLVLDRPGTQPPYAAELRVYRSTDAGDNWSMISPVLVNFGDSSEGFNHNFESLTANYHISADPNTNSQWVYPFYARTVRGGPPPAGPSGPSDPIPLRPKFQILYCRRSSDSGATWSAPIVVQSGDTMLPSLGYAQIPTYTPGAPSPFSPGFYRIARVWSSVDPTGRVHVVWFDNREGIYPPDNIPAPARRREYWNVYYSSSSNNGATWSAAQRVSTASSLSGYGNPGNRNADHRPPGDYICCDADSNTLYFAWCDSREYPDPMALTRVYFAGITL